MKKLFEWFNKRPATKAAWFAAFTGILALIVLIIQTIIISRQTNLINKQTQISKTQTTLLSNQIESSTRPFVDIRIVSDNNGMDTLLVENKGQYSISNVQVYQLYFANISNHGWYVSAPSNPIYSQTIKPKKTWTLNISNFPKIYKSPPLAEAYISAIKEEYLNILIFFDRSIDGKSYLCILPGNLIRTDKGIERWQEGTGTSGPLSKICDTGLEINYEYIKRKSFLKDFELYNSNYTLGYLPTGCLGKIDWKN